MPLAPLPPQIDYRLNCRLRRVVGSLRAIRFHRQSAIIWSVVAVLAALLWLAQRHSPVLAPHAAHLLVPLFVLATALAGWLVWRDRTGLRDAARYLGQTHPDARTALQAAIEQLPEPDRGFHFLQRRVVDDALRHADASDWYRRPLRQARWLLAAHAVAMAAALGVALLVLRAHRPAPSDVATVAAGSVEITPGDAELERGSAVVIAARFGAGTLPGDVILVWQPMGSPPQRATMHRSLSDPVFAFTLPAVGTDTAYHVEHDGARTRTFSLTVFDRPALMQADATLDYPDYTGLADRRIPDTRRVSAVVGSTLHYEFAMNKPLADATLRLADGAGVPLESAADRTRFHLRTVIEESARYTLHLRDDAGRTNAAPIDIRIEAVENRRPELKLTFPRGDQRVSPLEEMQLQAEVRDDFGLRDYGLGVSVADGAPSYRSLAPADEAERRNEAKLDHLLRLEEHDVKPDQLVTWFAWADDIGPDGQPRRTTSDVFFAEVRRLDEVFREDANGGDRGQSGGGNGGPGEELIEVQRQISIAIWKLRQQDTSAPSFPADAAILRDSQVQAQQQLAAVRERLEEQAARAAADAAAPLMQQAADALGEAAAQAAIGPLESAWTAARGAYQALLRMQSRDTQVSQSRSGGQAGGQRNRNQLNELEFRSEQDRYESETQAQPPPTPEEREQLQVLARLRELARRQQDLNSRLQELQTALAAAEDETAREAIRRELKRLEDEQRQMLAQLDEARQRVDRLQPGEQTRQAREQLDRTREDMQRAGEQLAEGQVSQALAAGTRAQENLRQTSEDFRREAAGRFGEQMREARRQARELAAGQQDALRELEEMGRGRQSLDDSAERESLAQRFENQATKRDQLLETLRQVSEDSEGSEPRLHRHVYDVLREQGQSGAGQQLAAGAELLRRGLIEPARQQQAPVTREFEQLQRAIERAAGTVLGDEASELRFAERELEDLTRALRRDRAGAAAGEQEGPGSGEPLAEAGPPDLPGTADSPRDRGTAEPAAGESPAAPDASGRSTAANGEPGAQPTARAGASSAEGAGNSTREGELTELAEFAREFGEASRASEAARGPLTGAGFGEWADRLRTVEELMDSPELRQRLAGARFQAEELRRANQQKAEAPRWELVEMGIVAPLEDARAWLRQELNRREQPDALQPIDRDPVPERYAESVRKYYEALGRE